MKIEKHKKKINENNSLNSCTFIKSASSQKDFLIHDKNEICFFGSSNVGKSSLINVICGQKNLARISKTPGRTQLINFFSYRENYIFVDLPGYGFAKVPLELRKSWEKLMIAYLKQKSNSNTEKVTALILVDAKKKLLDSDFHLMRILQECSINYKIVFTKIDKLNKFELDILNEYVSKNLSITSNKEGTKNFENNVVLTSASKKIGIDKLCRLIFLK